MLTDLMPWINHKFRSGEESLLTRAGCRLQRNDGGSLVEFALVLPFFLLLMTGIFSFGIAINSYMELTEATSLGAQQLAISRGNTSDPCTTAASSIVSAAPYLTASKVNFSITFTPQGGSAVGPFTGTGSSQAGSETSGKTTVSCDTISLSQGETAQVTTTYPCTLTAFGYNFGGCTLDAQVTEIVQ